jgi:hypothetical protein
MNAKNCKYEWSKSCSIMKLRYIDEVVQAGRLARKDIVEFIIHNNRRI